MGPRSTPDKDPRRRKRGPVARRRVRGAAPPQSEDAAYAPATSQPASDKSLSFLSRLATELTAVLSLSDLPEHVMRVLREETGFDSCSLALVDGRNPDFLVIRAASGIWENFQGLAIPRHIGLHGVVMQTGGATASPIGRPAAGGSEPVEARRSCYTLPRRVRREPEG